MPHVTTLVINFHSFLFIIKYHQCIHYILSCLTPPPLLPPDAGCLPPFLRLLSSSSAEVREQAVWAVGNIMGDSGGLRDSVVEEGAIPRLYDLVPGNSQVRKHSVTAIKLSNFSLFNWRKPLGYQTSSIYTYKVGTFYLVFVKYHW